MVTKGLPDIWKYIKYLHKSGARCRLKTINTCVPPMVINIKRLFRFNISGLILTILRNTKFCRFIQGINPNMLCCL